MATNIITVRFRPCAIAPANGYQITYRPLGSDEDLRTWPVNFTSSPAVFTDENDPEGTEYEGFIQGVCGDQLLGVGEPWATAEEESPSDSGGSASGSGSESGLSSIEGNIIMQSDCPGGAQQINSVVFALPPGDAPVEAGSPGDYPILPGETVPAAFVGVEGTGDLTVYYRETAFQMYVHVIDSLGNVFCAPTAFGIDEDNTLSISGVVLSTSPTTPWSVELSCSACA